MPQFREEFDAKLLSGDEMSTVGPLDMSQWVFYVVPKTELNEQCGNLNRLSLKKLLDLNPAITRRGEILDVVEKVASASH